MRNKIPDSNVDEFDRETPSDGLWKNFDIQDMAASSKRRRTYSTSSIARSRHNAGDRNFYESINVGRSICEDGFLLVITMVILVILTLIGLAGVRNSRVELHIAGNNRFYKETFYEADGGTEVGRYLLEENINCPNGFSGSAPKTIDSVMITADLADSLKFWANETEPSVDYPSDSTRHITFPAATAKTADPPGPHTNILFYGNSSLADGYALHMLAGYEGTGRGSAQGGGQLVTTISSQHHGIGGSRSTIRINWRHIIGLEGTCKY